MSAFAQKLIAWQRQHGRHHLPWQCDDPYRIWLSEIMLQQTQVASVTPYYRRFVQSFPDVQSLAAATQEQVLEHWSGLGYYARARNLHYAAQQICRDFGGHFPRYREGLEQLKGVGRSTAAAIAVFAWGAREAICDGNVKRVLARHFAIDADIKAAKSQDIFWRQAEALLPHNAADLKSYTQGLMDLGSLICKRSRPQCGACPFADDCQALHTDSVGEYPKKSGGSSKKSRDGYFLYCRRADGKILFRRRAEKALWGNLWILPWFDSIEALQDYAREQNLQAQSAAAFAFCHIFTHYRLNIHYQSYHTHQCELSDRDAAIRWLAPQEIHAAALPAAMKKLIDHISSA